MLGCKVCYLTSNGCISGTQLSKMHVITQVVDAHVSIETHLFPFVITMYISPNDMALLPCSYGKGYSILHIKHDDNVLKLCVM